MTPRTITRAAKDLQTAANRLALMTRNHNRDTILAGLFAGTGKGEAATARLDAQAPALAALEAQVADLRAELGTLLDRVIPAKTELPDLDLETEPPTRKRKKRK
jgi:hypothetical protein